MRTLTVQLIQLRRRANVAVRSQTLIVAREKRVLFTMLFRVIRHVAEISANTQIPFHNPAIALLRENKRLSNGVNEIIPATIYFRYFSVFLDHAWIEARSAIFRDNIPEHEPDVREILFLNHCASFLSRLLFTIASWKRGLCRPVKNSSIL